MEVSCEEKRALLSDMLVELQNCTRCPLHLSRTNVVLGDGNPCSEVMLVGEAPGRQEDLQGKPFVGKAGQLLDKMLASVGLSRDHLYITNVLKCRPPNNRDPLPEELSSCKPFLIRQVRLLEPKVVLTLGRYSLWTFLSRGVKISQVRGKLFYTEFASKKLIILPTFHPAFVLRNPKYEPIYKRDFQRLRELIDTLNLRLSQD